MRPGMQRLARNPNEALPAAKNYETARSEGPTVVGVRPVRIRFLD